MAPQTQTAFDDVRQALRGNLYRDRETGHAYRIFELVPVPHPENVCAPDIKIKVYDLTDRLLKPICRGKKHNIIEAQRDYTFLTERDLPNLVRIYKSDLKKLEKDCLDSMKGKSF